MKSKNNYTKENTLKKAYPQQQSVATPANKTATAPSPFKQQMIRLLPYILGIAMLGILGIMLYTQEWEMLYRSQELSLFIPTGQFYESMTIYPGGPLQWLACWATQFFYNPGTGVMLLLACWAAIMGLQTYLYRLRDWKFLLTLLPVILLMTAIVQSGYWIYYTKLQGYLFVPTLAVLISLALTAVYRLIRGNEADRSTLATVRKIVALAWIVFVAMQGYIYMGAWSFLALALMAIPSDLSFARNLKGNTLGICHCVLAVLPLVVAAICLKVIPPALYDNGTFVQTQYDTLYYASMPSFQYGKTDNEGMKMTYYLLALSLIPAMVMSFLNGFRLKTRQHRLLASIALIALLGGNCTYMMKRWYHDEAFQNEMKMRRLIEDEDWEGVLEVAPSWEVTDTTYTPTRAMVMMKNLALFRLGRAGDDMFNYLEGAKEQRMDSLTVRLTQVGGKLLYYNYGKLNFCYRWCMEDGVEFGWKVEHLKFMSRCALLKGEWKVAEKYLNLLKKTRYHREWAEKYEKYIGHPELMEQDPGMAPICKLKEFGDRLDGDNTLVELYLLRTFANGHGADPVYQEQTLLSSLIMKDIDLFWPRLYEYIRMHNQEKNFHLPRHYQEAAFLYSMLEPKRPSVLWPGMTNEQALKGMIEKKVFDESVVKSYDSFMNFNGQAHIAPLPESEKRKEFQPLFGNTFYYFYFLVRGQKTN